MVIGYARRDSKATERSDMNINRSFYWRIVVIYNIIGLIELSIGNELLRLNTCVKQVLALRAGITLSCGL